ncbi:MAG: MmgE/PrpD family protein [Deltaproteobacteria bacterium]|nr:MmgE/PrpD family protein [Deltaproteobacteria bacterium]
MELLTELGTFLYHTGIDGIPPADREAAKGRILDTVSCAAAGRDLPASQAVLKMVKAFPGNCTVVGQRDGVAMLEAALANAVMAHSTSQDDLMAGITHPGSVVVPAALAVAEHEGSSGAEVLVAVVLGYDVILRLLRATGRVSNPAFRPGTVFTAFGAAAAAGKLMKLDQVELGNTLGYAASLAPGMPNEGWWGGTMEPLLEMGMTSRTGIISALCARAGATAAPHTLEGRHGFFRCWSGTDGNPEEIVKGLGKQFAISRTFIKPFATCGANQVPVQIASTLAVHQLKAADIVKVVEKLRPGAGDYAGLDHKGPFISHPQALMSMQFCAAAAILGRPLDTPGFITRHYDDPEVSDLAAKVELVSETGRSLPGFEIHTKDGRVLTAEMSEFDRSIHVSSTEGMQNKLRRLGQACLGKNEIEKIIDLVMQLEEIDDIGKLKGCLTG